MTELRAAAQTAGFPCVHIQVVISVDIATPYLHLQVERFGILSFGANLKTVIYLLIYLSIYLFIYVFIYLFKYLYIYLNIYIYLYIYIFIYLFICLFIYFGLS
jgi:hypothetical protein